MDSFSFKELFNGFCLKKILLEKCIEWGNENPIE